MGAKAEYEYLLKKGELLELHPDLSGSWQEDKKKFTIVWEKAMDAINDIETDIDEYD